MNCYQASNKATQTKFAVYRHHFFPFSMRASGHYSLFIVHFLYHCEPRPPLKGRGLPLTGSAKVEGHAC